MSITTLKTNPIGKFIRDAGMGMDEYKDIEKEVYSSISTEPLLRAFYGFNIDVAFFVEHKLYDKFMIVIYANGWLIKNTKTLPKLNLHLTIFKHSMSGELIGVFQTTDINTAREELKWNNLFRKYNSKVFNLDGFAKYPWDIREKIIELMYNTITL